MALEEELIEKRKAMEKAREAIAKEKPEDELTDEEIEAVKELKESEWYKVLKKCIEKRMDHEKESVISLYKENFLQPKQQWLTVYEVIGWFLQGMQEYERIVDVITRDPEEVKKAIDEVNKADDEAINGKK